MATPADPAPASSADPLAGPATAQPLSATTVSPGRRFRRDSPALAAPDTLPIETQGGSARFLTSVAVVLAATVAAAYFANHWIANWAVEHHLRTAQLNLSAAMGGLFAGGLAALVAILIVTNIGKGGRRRAEPPPSH